MNKNKGYTTLEDALTAGHIRLKEHVQDGILPYAEGIIDTAIPIYGTIVAVSIRFAPLVPCEALTDANVVIYHGDRFHRETLFDHRLEGFWCDEWGRYTYELCAVTDPLNSTTDAINTVDYGEIRLSIEHLSLSIMSVTYADVRVIPVPADWLKRSGL